MLQAFLKASRAIAFWPRQMVFFTANAGPDNWKVWNASKQNGKHVPKITRWLKTAPIAIGSPIIR